EAMIAGVVGLLEAMGGRFDDARASGARSIALFEELGKPIYAAAIRGWACSIELYANEPDRAEAVIRPAFDTLTARGETGNLSTIAAYLAEALYAQGRLDEAGRATETSEECS